MSDHQKAAAHPADLTNETQTSNALVPSKAYCDRSRLRNQRIEAVKADVADAAALRSKMIGAMRRRLEAQAHVESAGGESDLAEESSKVLSLVAPAMHSAPNLNDTESNSGPQKSDATPAPLNPAVLHDSEIDCLFVPESEATIVQRPAPPSPRPLQPASFPEVWDEAFQSAQRVENALARLQEALERDERHAQKGRKRGVSKGPRSRRARPLRVATLFTASFMIGLSAVIFVYDWRSPISLEARLTEFARDYWPVQTMKIEDKAIQSTAKSVEQPLAAEPAQRSKKLAIVKLETHDAEGRAGSEIPLKIQALGAGGAVDLRLIGVPDGVGLSVGRRERDGSWLLKPQEQKLAALRVPAEVSGNLRLTIEALEHKSGDLATPPQEISVKIVPANIVVEPASSSITPIRPMNGASATEVSLAEPPVQELAAIEEAAEAPAMAIGITDPSRPLIARGDALMELGDVAAARSFYDRAFDLGNLRAARSIARTYDPVVLGSMKVQGLRGDPAKALEWYRKAEKAGASDAAQAIAALEIFLGQ